MGELPLPEKELTAAEQRASMTWAQRLKWVFGIDIETCPQCRGAVRIITYIKDPDVIEKILAHLDATSVSRKPGFSLEHLTS